MAMSAGSQPQAAIGTKEAKGQDGGHAQNSVERAKPVEELSNPTPSRDTIKEPREDDGPHKNRHHTRVNTPIGGT